MSDTPVQAILTSRNDHVAIIQLNRPPHNFFDVAMIGQIADELDRLQADKSCRVVVVQANGSAFCAGADFSKRNGDGPARSASRINPIYLEALRIFSFSKPLVAAIEGPAIGGGLGLALTADFRVSCAEARFSANFNRLGFHPGFALSHTLPALIGKQQAAWMFYTGARVDGTRAQEIGLVDFLAPQVEVRSTAMALALEIATSSPRAVQSTRQTLKADSLSHIRNAISRESAEQYVQFSGPDLAEGIKAMAERRSPVFHD
ncbi:enoyl-CoA hydratase [Alicycliphilus denitrificans]|uniref:enoyl-CoA hydratase/isomerase family protein n=1 Tax=Alicycliphilus denitrificans TaxID=179636 RepID=UPI00095F6430|nr:enoyl-CoA hydratase/isomerase family protein [Alicycliphilus denitrificans]MBN9575324.1 enoyl-CoA hydratase/isomerase family protein [Alicycliphilus denitrificans]OJW93100.1 MAG: enoyl-CoA hydratase [Alicycliphilus sp. 69-12]BCN37063.1 enoyl-CoA hydratase [Alicycliphilus denitrificans]HRP21147.1 enoyl-CoA hydratase/isomerase family protein [Alicycliphilus sp.]